MANSQESHPEEAGSPSKRFKASRTDGIALAHVGDLSVVISCEELDQSSTRDNLAAAPVAVR